MISSKSVANDAKHVETCCKHSKTVCAHAGNRTRVSPVKAECPNRLDYKGKTAKSKRYVFSELVFTYI